MKLLSTNKTLLFLAISALAVSARANTIAVTFSGVPDGINDGVDYVLPYQLNIDGILTSATCYDLYDNVTFGQSWTANELSLNDAAAGGYFSSDVNALADYSKVAFLSQQATNSAQDQIDLQHDIWNVFAPGTYSVDAGMQAYLDLLTTPAYAQFDFNSVLFLEDVNQGTGRAQAFVIDPPSAVPEPGTVALLGAGALLLWIGQMTRRKPRN